MKDKLDQVLTAETYEVVLDNPVRFYMVPKKLYLDFVIARDDYLKALGRYNSVRMAVMEKGERQ